MPDITLCSNPAQCPRADTCERAQAKPKEYHQSSQDFFSYAYGCDMYRAMLKPLMDVECE